MRWFWGLLIVSIGLLILVQNLGFIHNVSTAQLVQFWPLILILFGISLIVKHLKFGWVLVLISFVIAYLFIYYMIVNSHNLNSALDLKALWSSIRKIHR